MDLERFQKAAATLSTRPGVALLRVLIDGEWMIASKAAAQADVHISTATKHLSTLHEAGILQRREARSKTGRTHAYRMPSGHVTLSLDLRDADSDADSDSASASIDLVRATVRRAEELGWREIGARVEAVLRKAFSDDLKGTEGGWSRCLDHVLLESPDACEERIAVVLRAVRVAFEGAIGSIASEAIFLAALDEVGLHPALVPIFGDLTYREEVAA